MLNNADREGAHNDYNIFIPIPGLLVNDFRSTFTLYLHNISGTSRICGGQEAKGCLRLRVRKWPARNE